MPHEKQKRKRGKFTIGGYGEITAKHCFFSNNHLRYGKNPEKYANDHYGEFDLPHVVIYMGYDFGKGGNTADIFGQRARLFRKILQMAK